LPSPSLTVAAAQLGPIQRHEPRGDVVARLIALLEEAGKAGANLVVYPEAALTAFFPHWWVDEEAELDAYFETTMPNPAVQPLFDAAKRLGIAFCLGYAELEARADVKRRFNTSILVEADGRIVGKYRKIHLPGYAERQLGHPFQNLEKRYFDVGDLGFPVWDAFGARVGMMICNDRRWPESYRVMGLAGANLILLGYNTPVQNPAVPETDRLADFHNHLSLQAGAYQNSAWVIAAAKAGNEAGVRQIGGSCIVSPSGEIVARATTLADELVVAQCDIGLATRYKTDVFNFQANRRPEFYADIADPKFAASRKRGADAGG
jgi:predicted amidohydrolase